MSDFRLMRFLAELADASGDDALDLISEFQSGAITVEGISAEEALKEVNNAK
jgi:hypothetical protein